MLFNHWLIKACVPPCLVDVRNPGTRVLAQADQIKQQLRCCPIPSCLSPLPWNPSAAPLLPSHPSFSYPLLPIPYSLEPLSGPAAAPVFKLFLISLPLMGKVPQCAHWGG